MAVFGDFLLNINKRTNGLIDGRTDGRTDRQTDGRTNGHTFSEEMRGRDFAINMIGCDNNTLRHISNLRYLPLSDS